MRSKASSLAATVLSYEQESGAIATGPVNTAVRISHDEAGALAADTCCSSMFKADRSSGSIYRPDRHGLSKRSSQRALIPWRRDPEKLYSQDCQPKRRVKN